MPATRPERAVSRPLAILIEVPAVKGNRLRPARPLAAGHVAGRRPGARRAKRRLRREVRIAGCALLVIVTLVSAGSFGWSSRPARALTCSIADATAGDWAEASAVDPPYATSLTEVPAVGSSKVVVLSIEPAGLPARGGTEVPVVFPGYVLPDDSLEGSAHEGS